MTLTLHHCRQTLARNCLEMTFNVEYNILVVALYYSQYLYIP